MTAARCPRQDELLDALGRGFVPPELRAHAGECPSCAELQVVVGALLEERVAAVAEAPVPHAGTMWWRMRLRERCEAGAVARRSLLVGQAMTLAIGLVLALAALGAELTVGLRKLAGLLLAADLGAPLLVVLGAWLLLAPLVGWLAIRQE
jgi:hypothetical protein